MSKVLDPVLAIFLAAISYGIGFFHLSGYYGHFGISISELDISQQEFFVASATALREILLSSYLPLSASYVLGILVLCAMLTFLLYFALLPPLLRIWIWYLWWAVVLSFGVAMLFLGQMSGRQVAKSNLPALPFILLVDREDMLTAATSTNELRSDQLLNVDSDQLIFSDTNTIYVLRQNKNGNGYTTIRVPRAEGLLSFTVDYWRNNE